MFKRVSSQKTTKRNMFKPVGAPLLRADYMTVAALVALIAWGSPLALDALAPLLPTAPSPLKPFADLKAFRPH
jgi:hypothetical protein